MGLEKLLTRKTIPRLFWLRYARTLGERIIVKYLGTHHDPHILIFYMLFMIYPNGPIYFWKKRAYICQMIATMTMTIATAEKKLGEQMKILAEAMATRHLILDTGFTNLGLLNIADCISYLYFGIYKELLVGGSS